MKRLLSMFVLAAAGALAVMITPAAAHLPAFSATCPADIAVKVNRKGVVHINGNKAKLTQSGDEYFEARHDNITISIAVTGEDVRVSYTLKGGANGICTVALKSGDAGNTVMAGVGSKRAPWNCLVKDGKVAEVMSTVDEGAL